MSLGLKPLCPVTPDTSDNPTCGIAGGAVVWSRDVARWCRCGLSVAGPFVRRCLTSLTMLPFPHPAHRTGWADFPLPALGERFTMSPTGDGADIFVRDAVEHGAGFVL